MKKVTRTLICFICVCTLCVTQVIPVMAESKGILSASVLGSSGSESGSFSEEGDSNYYRYMVAGGSSVQLDIKITCSADAIVYIYDEDGNEYNHWYVSGSDGSIPKIEKVDALLNPGTYYIYIDSYWANAEGTYKMSYSTKTLNNTDLTFDDTIISAHLLPENANVKGILSTFCGDETDVYKLNVSKAGTYKYNLKFYMPELRVFLLDENGKQMKFWYFNDNDNLQMGTESFELALEKGTYYLQFKEVYSYDGIYEFSQKYTDIKSTEIEPNNSLEEAQSMLLGKKQNGMLGEGEDTDFYKIIIPSTRNLTISVSAQLPRMNIYIYDKEGEEVECIYGYQNRNTKKISVKEIYKFTKGTYFVQVKQPYDYSGRYTMSVSTTTKPAKPVVTLKRDNRNYYNLTVRHKKVAGATGYQVYLATNSKFKKAAKYTYTNSPTTYSVTRKKTWYVKVRAYKLNSDGQYIYGNFSKVKKIKM